MKKSLYIIVFVLLTKPFWPVLDYVVNYEYINKVLCENKAKPELKCNGKCHLMKEMAKSMEDEKPFSPSKKMTSEWEVLFLEPFAVVWTPAFFTSSSKPVLDWQAVFYASQHLLKVFRPPIF